MSPKFPSLALLLALSPAAFPQSPAPAAGPSALQAIRPAGGPAAADLGTPGAGPPFACGRYDDGTTENALGLNAGGEFGWYHDFTCTGSVGSVETAYGTLMFPGSVTNGSASRVGVYDDQDGDPGNGGTLVALVHTVVVNGDTDILNAVPVPATVAGGHLGLLVTADHTAGEFPGPMDQDNPTPDAWVVGSTLGPGTMDLADLANNSVPPMNMSAIGFPSAWLLRADDDPACLSSCPGTAVCFGDGSGAPCGCGNEELGGDGGCRNGLGSGAKLWGAGVADTTLDSLQLYCTDVPTQPGLFFQGDAALAGGDGVTFGDGIRCCGQNVVRLEVVQPSPPEPATAALSVTITEQGPPGTVNPGDTKCYQYWYRDPAGSPCGTGFNLSNGYSVTWV